MRQPHPTPPCRLPGLICLLAALLLTRAALAAPAAELWPRWQRFDPRSTLTVDHLAWGNFLRGYLRLGPDGIGRVAYGAVTPADREALAAYLEQLDAVPVSRLDRPEQMAFWINLYNALTVAVVIAHYPVPSIRAIDLSPGPFSRGPWRRQITRVEGEPLSLDDIEHRILRPIWHDPRVHYALNCAALGSPNLRPEPYTGRGLDQALDQAARAFVNDGRGMRLADGDLYVSSLYLWFEDDFGGDEAGVIRQLLAYASPAIAMRLQDLDRITGHGFDWRLNDAPPAAGNRGLDAGGGSP